VEKLLPSPAGCEVDDAELERLYAYPGTLHRPWVQVNFVSSADGAVTVEGRSRGLSNPADKAVFALGRDLADVVLVGRGTAVVEGYGGVKPTERRAERRSRLGLSPVPPIAVVTRSCSFPHASPLFTDTLVPPIVITCRTAPQGRLDALAEAGAEIVVAGEYDVDLRSALAALDERGLRRVCCEGGPRLFGNMIVADLVDQLCLTVSPLLVAGNAGRIALGPPPPQPVAMNLVSALHYGGSLLLRYRRER
jgi:5-amino-6-(5-phosphoribosylamino)uracil reductase